ncbi:MAG: hypothetical protein Kow00121_46210 [Elainellaceae cyanobacterium]
MAVPTSDSFVFQAQELPQKLSQLSTDTSTGYWLFEFPAAHPTDRADRFYLALLQGKVIFSGNQKLSWHPLLAALQRYVPRLRSEEAKQAIQALEQKLLVSGTQAEQAVLLPECLHELNQLSLVSNQEVAQALRLKVLSDFDAYLFHASGQARFLATTQLHLQAPIAGFGLEDLLFEVRKRQALWHKLQIQVPSMEHVPIINAEAVARSGLSAEQRQRLEGLVLHGKTLAEIAAGLAQDSLEVAKGFAQLIHSGLVSLERPTRNTIPKIVIVDDSPLILKQFKSLVTRWGYQVQLSQTSATALEVMLSCNPTIIFLDINMPGLNGFELVKQIRRQPKLADVPLIMLTAEKTLSNNWRAQWSGCKFLAKPLTPAEVPQFQMELRMLLEELAPLHLQDQREPHAIKR